MIIFENFTKTALIYFLMKSEKVIYSFYNFEGMQNKKISKFFYPTSLITIY